MKKALIILAACIVLGGCATAPEAVKCFLGISTKELEVDRKDAAVKVFDYDYNTCYAKAKGIIEKMPQVSIYAENRSMIAVYYTNPNVNPVGLFFTSVDAAHTKVEVSSASPGAKEWVAKNIFSEKVLPVEMAEPLVKSHKGGGLKTEKSSTPRVR